MSLIDLRSDTVTLPSPEMRRAMADAEVGDDVWGEDPTVSALEDRAADLLGKEAAVFVTSGTQANLVSLMAHLSRGRELIAGADSHIVLDEAAGHAVVVGASVRQIGERPDGTLDPDEVAGAFRDATDPHNPPTGLVAIENAHSHSMNQPLSIDYTERIASVAHAGGVPLHVDGARFFNSVVALSTSPATLAAPADSVAFCLSKGLACPAGSLVVGGRDFVARARRARKLLGGGMRQAGVLAAAGLVALAPGDRGMVDRLADDHANARRLAEGLAGMPGVVSAGGIAQPAPGPLDPGRVRTNFVLFRVERDRMELLDQLRSRGILMDRYSHGQVRAVTHYGVTAADIEATLEATAAALEATSRRVDSEPVAAGTA